MKIYFKNALGAGDHASILPALQYMVSLGHEVYTTQAHNLYQCTQIKHEQPGIAYDVIIPVEFTEEVNIPATFLKNKVKELTGIDVPDGITLPAVMYDEVEQLQIERAKRHPYVNVFPYTTIRQKSLSPEIARKIVEYLLSKGLKVKTSRPNYDSNTYPWDFVFTGCDYHRQYGYFSREWIMDIASAQLNICIDGGPVNVSLATGTKTLGLLTIADKSLCRLYPEQQWRVSQSTLRCSPCFKPADYGTKEVKMCLQPNDPCGANFNLNDIYKKIEELL